LALSERADNHLYAKDDNGNPYAPSWFTFNAKASYQLMSEISIDVGVENILDKRYRPYASGITAPGRNLIISLRGRL
jgi:hemoglobin/transferrin/lactoferrin receptor protein